MIAHNAKLDYQIGYLVIRGSETVKIHLNEIGTVIIESTAVSMTAYLLSELIKHKIKVIMCDEKRNPISELLPYYGSHDTSAKIRKQCEWTSEEKSVIWTEIVTEKIQQQMIFLKKLDKKEEANLLESYIDNLEFRDSTNREGHAAKVYFNAIFGKEFTRTKDTSVNAALNYGYSILLSSFNREIVANGYITQIGLCHDNMFNQFNFACDLMEPFRPLVDEIVYQMQPQVFETEEKHKMIAVMNREVFIEGRCEYLSNAIKIYVKSIFNAISERDVSLIRYYRNEL